jgi:hypothetical protein
MLGSIAVGFLASTTLLLSLGSIVIPARLEQPQPSIGYGMFCDTGEEIEAAVGIYSHDIADVLSRVNERFGHESCNVLTAAYVRSEETRTVLVEEGIVHVIKVSLVGFRSGSDWRQMPVPREQYVAVFEKATRV